jgi:uncharacterized membrane protein
MNTIKKYLLTGFAAIFLALTAYGQTASTKSDFFESTGKIYVVVAVIVVIFLGILALLISLERRLAKIEKEEKGL